MIDDCDVKFCSTKTIDIFRKPDMSIVNNVKRHDKQLSDLRTKLGKEISDLRSELKLLRPMTDDLLLVRRKTLAILYGS